MTNPNALYETQYIGRKFHMLEVTKYIGKRIYRGNRTRFFKAKCLCGKECELFTYQITKESAKSCGCARGRKGGATQIIEEIEMSKNPVIRDMVHKHAQAKKPEYRVWSDMINACAVTGHPQYPSIGGKGIKVCPRWCTEYGIFLSDMGKLPSDKHVLIRRDESLDFFPENCRWRLLK